MLNIRSHMPKQNSSAAQFKKGSNISFVVKSHCMKTKSRRVENSWSKKLQTYLVTDPPYLHTTTTVCIKFSQVKKC